MTAIALDNLPAARPRFNPTVVRETAWLAGGFVAKLLIQMGTLYYLTRTLGRDGTGTFYAVVSLLACLTPFVQLGNYDLTVRDVARRMDPRVVAGRAMRSSAAAFVCLLPIVVLLRPWVAPTVAWVPFFMVVTGELLVMRVTSNVQAVATGFRQHYVTAVSDFLLGLSRLAALYAAFRLGAGVDVVLMLYAFTSVPATVVAYGWLVRRIGRPTWRGGPLFAGVAEHARMVVAWFAEMAAREGDKPLLAAVAGAGETGIYGTATKLLGVMLAPVDVLTQVVRPRLGRAYADSAAAGRRLYHLTAAALTACGLLAGGAMFAAAVLAPRVAPQLIHGAFADARLALMWLSLVPPIYGLQRANIVAAISRGQTSAYARSTCVSAVVGLATLLALGHRMGWRAACVASPVYLATSCAATWWLSRAQPTAADRPVDEVLPELESAAHG